MDKTNEAKRHFQRLTARHADEPTAWLGLGLASFILEDLDTAENAFIRCLALKADHVAAKMNLAMTSTEQGKLKEAITAWRSISLDAVTETERSEIAAWIEELKDALQD